MADMVMASYAGHEDAEKSIRELQDAGYEAEQISVMMKGEEGEPVAGNPNMILQKGVVTRVSRVGLSGAVIGGLAGLLVGIAALTIPGLGFLLFAGPLAEALGLGGAAATTVTGAVTGAAAGGLLGVLESFGIPSEAAKVYAKTVEQGGVVLAVPVKEGGGKKPEDIMESHNAQEVRVVHVKE